MIQSKIFEYENYDRKMYDNSELVKYCINRSFYTIIDYI